MFQFVRHHARTLPAACARLFCLLAFACFAVSMARADEKRDILVQALTNSEVEVQVQLVQKLVDSSDPIVAQALNAWRRGSVYLLDATNDTKIPFMLDVVTDSEGKARG